MLVSQGAGNGTKLVRSRGMRLLYVEDDEDHRELFAAFLGASGFLVTTAKTGAEATAALEVTDYDVLLADVTLPDLDGWQVAAAARARRPGVRVVMLTGYDRDNLALATAGSLADEVVTKPVTPLDLLTRLR